jgi:tetratricopeptide (TPR) repeat protein
LVIKKNPKNAHAYFRRSFSLKALKSFEKAAKGFEKAKNLDPLNPHLVINHKKLKGVNCIVLCQPGEEKAFLDHGQNLPRVKPRIEIGSL